MAVNDFSQYPATGNATNDPRSNGVITANTLIPGTAAQLSNISDQTNTYNISLNNAAQAQYLFSLITSATSSTQANSFYNQGFNYLTNSIIAQINVKDINSVQAQAQSTSSVESMITTTDSYISQYINIGLNKTSPFITQSAPPPSTVQFISSVSGTSGSSGTQYYLYPIAVQGSGLNVTVSWNTFNSASYYKVFFQDASKYVQTAISYTGTVNFAATVPGISNINVNAYDVNDKLIASQPTTLNVTGSIVIIPNVSGLDYNTAYNKLNSLGLTVYSSVISSTQSQYQSYNALGGYVFSQSPAPGNYINILAITLTLIIYTPSTSVVPNIVGLTLNNAQNALTQVGLVLGTKTSQLSTNSSQDQYVFSQDQNPGTTVTGGTAINVSYYIYQAASVSPVGVSPVGVSPVGVSPVGVSPVGVSPVGVSPVGVSPVGVSPVGVSPVGVSPVGVSPVGVSPVGVSPVGVSPATYCFFNPPVGVSPVGVSPATYCFFNPPVGVSPVGVSPVGVGGCLAYGTMIRLSNGSSIEIERLKVGMELSTAYIPSYPQTENPEDWSPASVWSAKTLDGIIPNTTFVQNVAHRINQGVYTINEFLKITWEHYVFIKRNGLWQFVQAQDLKVGDSFMSYQDNSIVPINTITYDSKMTMVVTLTTGPDHLYYADDILVHNILPVKQ